ncbi:MAG: RNA recognition motif domain-containing protein [Trichloromonadaceae bacterium]
MSKDLYIKNISPEATEEDLRKLFSLCGKVSYIHLVNDSKTGQFVGAGYIKMSTEAEAKDARVTLDGTLLINRMIVVTEALPRTRSGGPKEESAPAALKKTKSTKPPAWGKPKASKAKPAGKPETAAKPGKPSASKPRSKSQKPGKPEGKRRPPR